jgi:hypothetical protein
MTQANRVGEMNEDGRGMGVLHNSIEKRLSNDDDDPITETLK